MAAGSLETRQWRLAAVFAAGVAGSPRPAAEHEGATFPRRIGP